MANIMSLEYEIDKYIERVRRTLLIQRNILIKDFISSYMPAINTSIYSEGEDESEDVIDSFYFADLLKIKESIGSAS
jgi:hypothetical protein